MQQVLTRSRLAAAAPRPRRCLQPGRRLAPPPRAQHGHHSSTHHQPQPQQQQGHRAAAVAGVAVKREPSAAAAAGSAVLISAPRQQQQKQQQQQRSGWWPFGQKAAVQAVRQVSEPELWAMLEAEQTVPLVVVFSAHWCGPCKIMMQRLEAAVKSLGGPTRVQAVKLDTDECPELATALQVYKLPTLFFVGPNGAAKPAAQVTGLLPEAVLHDMVSVKSSFLGSDIRSAITW